LLLSKTWLEQDNDSHQSPYRTIGHKDAMIHAREEALGKFCRAFSLAGIAKANDLIFDVRDGSKAVFAVPKSDFCSTHNNGHAAYLQPDRTSCSAAALWQNPALRHHLSCRRPRR
jgi:hypothetical protein